MIKTTVYLPDDEAAALRRLARQSGRSQAEIIREAITAGDPEGGTAEVPLLRGRQGQW